MQEITEIVPTSIVLLIDYLEDSQISKIPLNNWLQFSIYHKIILQLQIKIFIKPATSSKMKFRAAESIFPWHMSIAPQRFRIITFRCEKIKSIHPLEKFRWKIRDPAVQKYSRCTYRINLPHGTYSSFSFGVHRARQEETLSKLDVTWRQKKSSTCFHIQ